MSQNAIPYLLYEDVGAAVDWLVEAFGYPIASPTPEEWGAQRA